MILRYRKTAASASEAPCNYRTPPRPAVRHSGCRCARLASPAGEAEGPLTIIVLRASPPRGCLGRCLESGGETARRGAHRASGYRLVVALGPWSGEVAESGMTTAERGWGYFRPEGRRGQEGACAPKEMHSRARHAGSRSTWPLCLCRDRREHKPGCAHFKMPGLSPGVAPARKHWVLTLCTLFRCFDKT